MAANKVCTVPVRGDIVKKDDCSTLCVKDVIAVLQKQVRFLRKG